ncbi:hypothetical protein F7725_006184 [Dissostichus mawsoni]|uniref:Uncharacterized protein n=1 Tax=Dissostichus mawsoni TaxID=36200 RepID=A0A7J5YVR6_DISMA|nr:hypothetical protein F7725_006184 [Dissostichus mawsoni]
MVSGSVMGVLISGRILYDLRTLVKTASVRGQTCKRVIYIDRSICAFKGGQTCNRVIYTERSICALKGSSVDISCTYSSFEDDLDSDPEYENDSHTAAQAEQRGAGRHGVKSVRVTVPAVTLHKVSVIFFRRSPDGNKEEGHLKIPQQE